MSSISSLVLSQARSAVDEAIYIVQGKIKAQSEQLAKQIEASSGMRRQLGAPPTTQSVVGGLNPTTAICQPLGLPLGNKHPGTILRRSERLAARLCDHGATAEGAEPPEHGWDLHTRDSFTTQILDLPPRPRAYSERRSIGVTYVCMYVLCIQIVCTYVYIGMCVYVCTSVYQRFSTCGPRPTGGPRTSAWWAATKVGNYVLVPEKCNEFGTILEFFRK